MSKSWRSGVKEARPEIVILCVAFGLATVAWLIGSYMEAKAYNNVTGKNVSTWDAMWIELRVQESAK